MGSGHHFFVWRGNSRAGESYEKLMNNTICCDTTIIVLQNQVLNTSVFSVIIHEMIIYTASNIMLYYKYYIYAGWCEKGNGAAPGETIKYSLGA